MTSEIKWKDGDVQIDAKVNVKDIKEDLATKINSFETNSGTYKYSTTLTKAVYGPLPKSKTHEIHYTENEKNNEIFPRTGKYLIIADVQISGIGNSDGVQDHASPYACVYDTKFEYPMKSWSTRLVPTYSSLGGGSCSNMSGTVIIPNCNFSDFGVFLLHYSQDAEYENRLENAKLELNWYWYPTPNLE